MDLFLLLLFEYMYIILQCTVCYILEMYWKIKTMKRQEEGIISRDCTCIYLADINSSWTVYEY